METVEVQTTELETIPDSESVVDLYRFVPRKEFKKELIKIRNKYDDDIRLVLCDFAQSQLFPGWWPRILIPIRNTYTIGINVFGEHYGSVEWRMLGLSVRARYQRKKDSFDPLEINGKSRWNGNDHQQQERLGRALYRRLGKRYPRMY